ncbi:MAG TPA: hypothetical protein VK184_26740 [Nostocaceae cyanobacterium]|nr:hypothetical protein [Nostocaceae cyanobacterium]
MDRNINRLLLLVISCSTVGVILGGTAGWAESNLCWRGNNVSNECITQSTTYKTVKGMGTGMLAGMGAAFGAVWNIRPKD